MIIVCIDKGIFPASEIYFDLLILLASHPALLYSNLTLHGLARAVALLKIVVALTKAKCFSALRGT